MSALSQDRRHEKQLVHEKQLDALLKRVSRSFYLSLAILPSRVRGQLKSAYLVARAADTIADTRILPADRRLELLAALNTGHAGGCGTLHANSAADVVARVEALALAAGLSRAATHSQLASAIEAVLHLERGRDGRRRLREVAVPIREADGLVRLETAVAFDPAGVAVPGPAEVRLAERLAP